jgi:hypothetical protein
VVRFRTRHAPRARRGSAWKEGRRDQTAAAFRLMSGWRTGGAQRNSIKAVPWGMPMMGISLRSTHPNRSSVGAPTLSDVPQAATQQERFRWIPKAGGAQKE